MADRMVAVLLRSGDELAAIQKILEGIAKIDRPVLREGMELGRAEGRNEGRTEGERHVILRQRAQRFGRLPEWARNRLDAMSTADIDRIAVRLLDAANLDDLLR